MLSLGYAVLFYHLYNCPIILHIVLYFDLHIVIISKNITYRQIEFTVAEKPVVPVFFAETMRGVLFSFSER